MKEYQKYIYPKVKIVDVKCYNDILQDVIMTSAQQGPFIDPEDIITNPNDPHAGLANHISVWDNNL